MEVNLNINEHFLELFNEDNKKRYKVLIGGAGSGKSVAVSQKIVLDCFNKEPFNTLIVRKVFRSIRTSCYNEISKIIHQLNLMEYVNMNESNLIITNKVNGNQIIFAGLDDVEKLKSITPKKGIINQIWMEEASQCDQTDLQQLILRQRGTSQYSNSIIISFNPISEHHWLKKHFFDNPGDDVWINKSTYKNNVYIQETTYKDMEKMKETDYNYYRIYALGEWGSLESKIFSNYEYRDFDINSFEQYSIGLDFGSTDPTAIILIAKEGDEIYICKETKEVGLLNNSISSLLKYEYDYNTSVIADSAAANQINELRNLKHNITPCTKGPDSIISGINYLKQHKLVVHPSCVEIYKELELYSWQKDRLSNLDLPYPVDKNNHLIDALRYACDKFKLSKGPVTIKFTPIINCTKY